MNNMQRINYTLDLKKENERLKRENDRLKRQLELLKELTMHDERQK